MQPEEGRAPTPAVALPYGPLSVAGAQFFVGPGALFTVSWWETTGVAPAVFDVLDGADANGTRLIRITSLANESDIRNLGPLGLAVQRGLFINVISGSVAGVLGVLRGQMRG